MPNPLQASFESWCAHQQQIGSLRHASSVAVYQAMWAALVDWCAQQPALPHLAALDGPLLQRYLRSRSGLAGPGQALTVRYRLRLLALVRRVQDHGLLRHDSLAASTSPQHPAHRRRGAAALAWSQAQWAAKPAASAVPPDALGSLGAAQGEHLIDWLMQTGPAAPGATAAATWRVLRDRCALALQLGAGLGPGDLRALRLASVQPPAALGGLADMTDTADLTVAAHPTAPPSQPRTPAPAMQTSPPAEASRPTAGWWLHVPANGNAPAYRAPVAAWAAGLLQRWLAYRALVACPGTVLFPSTRSGKPWGKVAQYASVRQTLMAAGLADGPGGSFRLRHSFALRQLVHGHPPDTVAAWLGVHDPQVMQRYRQALGLALIDHAAHAAHADIPTAGSGAQPVPWPV